MADDMEDYTQWTLERLLSEEKALKKNGIIAAFAIGFLIGIIIFGVAKKGFGFLHIFIPLFLIFGINKHSEKQRSKLQTIRAELAARESL